MDLVAYCGLYCVLCTERTRIPQRAAALRTAMADEGWPFWGPSLPDFAQFWAFLERLQANGGCPACRPGDACPECQIRFCAQQRGQELCCHCTDVPCDPVQALAARYPTLLADNQRLQAVSLRQRLDE